MTADRLRGGYCDYPGTPPGNPDWWTRDQRPHTPALLAAEPPAAWRRALALIEPDPAPLEPITPTPAPVDQPVREPATASMARYWIAQAAQAAAPARKPDEPRRWWHYLTARRR